MAQGLERTTLILTAAVVMTGVILQLAGAQETDSCQSQEDCNATPNSNCTTGEDGTKRCQCIPSHNNQSGVCEPNKLGDVCTNNDDCSDIIDNTFCPKKVGLCRCKPGYRKHSDNECKALEVGSNCQWNRQCKAVIANSVCKQGSDEQKTCVCLEGYHPETTTNNTTTCERITYGSRCNLSSECRIIGENVACIGGVCDCDHGFMVENGTLLCTPIKLNGVCSKQNDCNHITNSVCEPVTSRCVCDTWYREEKDTSTCVRTLHFTACDFDEHCPTTNSICDHATGFCTCKDRFVSNEEGSDCFFRYLGDLCVQDEDCSKFVPNSQCINQQCACGGDYLPSENATDCNLPIIGTMNCTNNNTCQSAVEHSFCKNDAVCACQIGYGVTSDFHGCREKKLLDSCSSNEDCLVTNTFTECSGKPEVCRCISGYVTIKSDQLDVKSRCRRRVLGRHDCQIDTDCSSAVENSTCVACRDLKNNPFCTDQCQGYDLEFCSVKTCECHLGFYQVEGGTRCQKRELLDACELDEDCSASVESAVCMPSRVCYCKPGFQPLGSDKCEKRVLGDACYVDENCEDAIPNSFCKIKDDDAGTVSSNPSDFVHGTCLCKSGHTPINGTICQKRRIGDKTCSKHTDCSDAVSGSVCSSGMCVCRPGFIPGVRLKTCTERSLHGPHCSSNMDCNAAVPHSECLNHQCVCEAGYRKESDKECVKFELGDTGCRNDEDCTSAVNDSKCLGNESRCVCVTGYHPDVVTKQECIARNISGHICHKDEDCWHSVVNSYCKDEQCACVSGYYHKDDGTECVMRVLGDMCQVTSDCLDVIKNSTCHKEICTCADGFDPEKDNAHCFPRPKFIGSPCISDAQCHAIDSSSTCSANENDVIKKCVCHEDMFVDRTRKECVKMPTRAGHRCRISSQCAQGLIHSICHRKEKKCACQDGFFEDEDGFVCTPEAVQFGDRCLQNSHCSQLSTHVVCDKDNNTCICQYGYTQNSSVDCIERPLIPTYKRYPAPRPPKECKGTCNQTNTICVDTVENSISHCKCDLRFAAAYNRRECVPVQTYLYKAQIIQEAGKYDYRPMLYRPQYKSSQILAFQRFAQRITLNGLMHLMRSIPIGRRFISSKVLTLKPVSNETDEGVEASILLHFKATRKYYGATPARIIDSVVRKQLSHSQRELGISRLKLAHPLTRSSLVTDFDECESPDHNDCFQEALCINTLGSFMCVCRSDHVDISLAHGKRKGRVCKVPDTTDSDSGACSSDDCETQWEFVGLVLTLFLLVITSFIVYEIIQRKQNFNARKLYERFGTTKIRRLKLNTASLRRLHERKKKKKNSKKKKKGTKKKGKGSGTEDSDIEKSPSTPTDLGTEEIGPSPIEIIHSPAAPVEDEEFRPKDMESGASPLSEDYGADSVTVFIDD